MDDPYAEYNFFFFFFFLNELSTKPYYTLFYYTPPINMHEVGEAHSFKKKKLERPTGRKYKRAPTRIYISR
jgi:hypothetical protein